MLVDDFEDVRRLARISLQLAGASWEIVGEAGDGREAVDIVSRSQPDLVLMDLEMPWLDGVEAIPDIQAAAPDTVIVVWTGHPESDRATAALQLGAEAVLGKTTTPARLLSDELLRVFADRSR